MGTVHVGFEDGIGEVGAMLRDELGGLNHVSFDGPSDVVLKTDPDFPYNLTLDLKSSRPGVIGLPGSGGDRVYLGNVMLGEHREALLVDLAAAGRIAALKNWPDDAPDGLDVCVRASFDNGQERPCHRLFNGRVFRTAMEDAQLSFTVTNRSSEPRYVGLFGSGYRLEIYHIGGKDLTQAARLEPGESRVFEGDSSTSMLGDKPTMFLVSSPRPFALAPFEQSGADNVSSCIYFLSEQSCGQPLAPIGGGQQFAVRSVMMELPSTPIAAMAGGEDAPPEIAMFMAELYSTIPYTAAEIAADSRLPDDRKLFLADRSGAERDHRCGGSLVGPNLVLTAAHCVAKGQYVGAGMAKVLKQRRIRLGTNLLGRQGETYALDAVAVPAAYDPESTHDDIALILLRPDRGSRGVTGKSRIVTLASAPAPAGIDVQGFGWGFTREVEANSRIQHDVEDNLLHFPDLLQVGEMRSIDWLRCQKKMGSDLYPGTVCVISRRRAAGDSNAPKVFSCRGDSGGPLVRQMRGRTVQVGLTSWSRGCGFKDYPSVYTDVGHFRAWIEAAKAALKPGTVVRVPEPARARR